MEFHAADGGENDGTNGSGNVYRYNCFGPDAAGMFQWGATFLDTYAALESAYGSAMSNVEADPLFVAPDNGDFTLQVGSPALSAASDGGNLGAPRR